MAAVVRQRGISWAAAAPFFATIELLWLLVSLVDCICVYLRVFAVVFMVTLVG